MKNKWQKANGFKEKFRLICEAVYFANASIEADRIANAKLKAINPFFDINKIKRDIKR